MFEYTRELAADSDGPRSPEADRFFSSALGFSWSAEDRNDTPFDKSSIREIASGSTDSIDEPFEPRLAPDGRDRPGALKHHSTQLVGLSGQDWYMGAGTPGLPLTPILEARTLEREAQLSTVSMSAPHLIFIPTPLFSPLFYPHPHFSRLFSIIGPHATLLLPPSPQGGLTLSSVAGSSVLSLDRAAAAADSPTSHRALSLSCGPSSSPARPPLASARPQPHPAPHRAGHPQAGPTAPASHHRDCPSPPMAAVSGTHLGPRAGAGLPAVKPRQPEAGSPAPPPRPDALSMPFGAVQGTPPPQLVRSSRGPRAPPGGTPRPLPAPRRALHPALGAADAPRETDAHARTPAGKRASPRSSADGRDVGRAVVLSLSEGHAGTASLSGAGSGEGRGCDTPGSRVSLAGWRPHGHAVASLGVIGSCVGLSPRTKTRVLEGGGRFGSDSSAPRGMAQVHGNEQGRRGVLRRSSSSGAHTGGGAGGGGEGAGEWKHLSLDGWPRGGAGGVAVAGDGAFLPELRRRGGQ